MGSIAEGDYTSRLESCYTKLLHCLTTERSGVIIDIVKSLEYLCRMSSNQTSRFVACSNNFNQHSCSAGLLKTRSNKNASEDPIDNRKRSELNKHNRSKLHNISSASPRRVSSVTARLSNRTSEKEGLERNTGDCLGDSPRRDNTDTVEKLGVPLVTCSGRVQRQTIRNCQTFSNKDIKKWLASKNAHILEARRRKRDEQTRRLAAEKEAERQQLLRAGKASVAFELWLKHKNSERVKLKRNRNTKMSTKDDTGVSEAEEIEVHLSEHEVGRLNSTDAPILPGKSVTPYDACCPFDVVSVESTLSHETIKENSAVQTQPSLPLTNIVDQTLTNSACLRNPLVQVSPKKGLQKSPLSGNKQSTSSIDVKPAVKMTHNDWLVLKEEQAQRHQQVYRKTQQQIALLKRLDPKFLEAWTNLLKVRLTELEHRDPLTNELLATPRSFSEDPPIRSGNNVTRMVPSTLDNQGSTANGNDIRRRRLRLNVPPSAGAKQKIATKLRKPGVPRKTKDSQPTEVNGLTTAASGAQSSPEAKLDSTGGPRSSPKSK